MFLPPPLIISYVGFTSVPLEAPFSAGYKNAIAGTNLGHPDQIRSLFIGFQQYLYRPAAAGHPYPRASRAQGRGMLELCP